MDDGTRKDTNREGQNGSVAGGQVRLVQDLIDCLVGFMGERVTPAAEVVARTGGDPKPVVLAVAETLHGFAAGLESDVSV